MYNKHPVDTYFKGNRAQRRSENLLTCLDFPITLQSFHRIRTEGGTVTRLLRAGAVTGALLIALLAVMGARDIPRAPYTGIYHRNLVIREIDPESPNTGLDLQLGDRIIAVDGDDSIAELEVEPGVRAFRIDFTDDEIAVIDAGVGGARNVPGAHDGEECDEQRAGDGAGAKESRHGPSLGPDAVERLQCDREIEACQQVFGTTLRPISLEICVDRVFIIHRNRRFVRCRNV